jgi:hypothetical protein
MFSFKYAVQSALPFFGFRQLNLKGNPMQSNSKTAITTAVSTTTPFAAAEGEKPTVVLVHGAFADGSTWRKVIPLLQEKGLKVVAVQNPLSSLADDVMATQDGIHETDLCVPGQPESRPRPLRRATRADLWRSGAVDAATLIPHMLEAFMAGDRGFRKGGASKAAPPKAS